MKTFVLTVSKVFPSTHSRKGEPTFFKEQILTAQMNYEKGHGLKEKLHTIRANYELWENRIEQVKKGEAILSIRYWSEKPYRSKQIEICQLDKNSGIGIQELFLDSDFEENLPGSGSTIKIEEHIFRSVSFFDLSENDGLSLNDFKEWFKNYDLSEPLAIIHFTPMRY